MKKEKLTEWEPVELTQEDKTMLIDELKMRNKKEIDEPSQEDKIILIEEIKMKQKKE